MPKQVRHDFSVWQSICGVSYVETYKSAYKNTGVIAYEATLDGIAIKFRDGSVYLYTKESTGAYNIAQMKHLAQKGAGLTTYINQHVREKYQQKLA